MLTVIQVKKCARRMGNSILRGGVTASTSSPAEGQPVCEHAQILTIFLSVGTKIYNPTFS
jgi:hypothetical protein